MKFRVRGINRSTGQEATGTVEAANAAEAHAIASRSMDVREVVAIATPAGQSPAMSPAEDPLAELAAAAQSHRPAPVQYASSARVPEYAGIVAGAFVLRILSYVAYAGAAIILLAYIMWLTDAVKWQRLYLEPNWRSIAIAATVGAVAAIMAYVMLGALLGLLASLSIAVRDMARNSFRR